jgi:FG-GAP-like repeat
MTSFFTLVNQPGHLAKQIGMKTHCYTYHQIIESVTAMKAIILICGIAITLFASRHQAVAQSFGVFSNPIVGSHPNQIVAIDVNNDGKLDLICANDNTNGTLTVLTNNGGGFGSNMTLQVGSEPNQLISADINGDGKADLITANSGTNTLSVLTNNGNGGFGSNATYTVGDGPISVAAADFNNDGRLDLICAMARTNTLLVLTNNGSGHFGFNATYSTSSSGWVVAADVNGDGWMDVAYVNADNDTLTVMTNRGNGFLKTNGVYAVGSEPVSVAAADINGDGKVDLICANMNSTSLSVLTNNGSGIFTLASSPRVGTLDPEAVIAADLNGDGKPDLVCAMFSFQGRSYGDLLILTNSGGGQFQFSGTNFVTSYCVSAAAADINGDGKLDLISADFGLPSSSGNTLITVLTNSTIFPPPASMPSLDINRSRNTVLVSWPSVSAGWSLQQNSALTTTNWSPGGYNGYDTADDGTYKTLIVPLSAGNLFFRLLHP